MTLNTPVVFLLLGISIVLLSLDRIRRLRKHLFLLVSFAFVGLLYGEWPCSLAFLLGFVVVHYLVLRIMLATTSTSLRLAIHWTWLLAALASFVVVKKYFWLVDLWVPYRMLAFEINTIGLSFLIFRQIHLGVEIRDGVLREIAFLDYLSYLLAFWTFLAGPVQRFESFHEEFEALRSPGSAIAAKEVLWGLNRTAFGYIKLFLISPYFEHFANTRRFIHHPDASHLLVFLLAYPLYMYINFSGYCDIVIGVARSVSFKLPENFNHPYRARNVVDYWNRWHITMSQFFRDYMYFPIYTFFARRTPQGSAMSLAAMISFLVMGAWHGNTLSYVVFGLIHGVGVVVVNLYTALLKRLFSREQLKAYRKNLVVTCCAVVLCQTYVLLAFLPFAYSWPDLMEVYRCLCH